MLSTGTVTFPASVSDSTPPDGSPMSSNAGDPMGRNASPSDGTERSRPMRPVSRPPPSSIVPGRINSALPHTSSGEDPRQGRLSRARVETCRKLPAFLNSATASAGIEVPNVSPTFSMHASTDETPQSLNAASRFSSWAKSRRSDETQRRPESELRKHDEVLKRRARSYTAQRRPESELRQHNTRGHMRDAWRRRSTKAGV